MITGSYASYIDMEKSMGDMAIFSMSTEGINSVNEVVVSPAITDFTYGDSIYLSSGGIIPTANIYDVRGTSLYLFGMNGEFSIADSIVNSAIDYTVAIVDIPGEVKIAVPWYYKGRIEKAVISASRDIDSYLSFYPSLPLDPVPPFINLLCVYMAVYHLYYYSQDGKKVLKSTPAIRDQYLYALSRLQEIADSQVIPGFSNASSVGIAVNSRKPIWKGLGLRDRF